MRKAGEIFKIVFLLVGAVIGAGFLSGAELVAFFGTEGFLPFVVVSGLLFWAGFSTVFSGVNDGRELYLFNKKDTRSVFPVLFVCADYVFMVSMLAGMNGLSENYKILGGVPLFSAVSLAVAFFFSEKSKKGAEVINTVLMPAAIVFINVLIIRGDGLSVGGANPNPAAGAGKCALFALMNIFVSVPVAAACAKDKKRSSLYIAAGISALIIAVQAAVILAAVRRSGNAAALASLPLLFALGTGGISLIFCAALFIGMFTSFYSCYCPLAAKAGGRFGKKGILVLVVSAFLFSLAGLDAIIVYVYPLVGAIGAVYIFRLLYDRITFRIKKHDLVDNNFISGNRRS